MLAIPVRPRLRHNPKTCRHSPVAANHDTLLDTRTLDGRHDIRMATLRRCAAVKFRAEVQCDDDGATLGVYIPFTGVSLGDNHRGTNLAARLWRMLEMLRLHNEQVQSPPCSVSAFETRTVVCRSVKTDMFDTVYSIMRLVRYVMVDRSTET